MVPSEQCFDSLDLVGLQIDLRLVKQLQLVSGNCLTQVRFHFLARDHCVIHFVFKVSECAATAPFCLVQSQICHAQQVLTIAVCAVFAQGNPDACTDEYFISQDVERL